MAKKKVVKKAATKKQAVKLSLLQRLVHKHHRPLHLALLGSGLLFLKGFFAVVGLALVLFGAFSYLKRSARG